jgi:predicted Holliday junction resolvase-like endonuclease
MSNSNVFLFLLIVIAIMVALYLGMWLKFERWKAQHSREIRQDAVQRSQSVTVGKVYEQLVPLLPDFQWNPKDARFIGSPVDYVVFDGLYQDRLERIIFVEVKTGGSTMSTRERAVRDAIAKGRVEWQELRLPPVQP